ncbi:MAG: filamentous hemagglutinin N-terminal domain-containing protein, partial [Cyanobacteria bacterium P01_F01_bin.86]
MTRSPVILINRFVHGSLEVSPAVLLSWVMMHAAIAPLTKAATTPSPSNPSQANFVTQQAALDAVLIETRVATVAAPTTTAFPQFSQPLDQPLHLAQAITAAEDGTGTVVTQTDNTFDITGGTLAGENLFHSFEQFGLSADQIANILATPDIENVLGRINGGNPSVINGLLQLTGGDANLFLINPAGIIFGPEAQVLVPAAFTATTADAIQFDDEWFHAIGTNDYASLVGNPTGFAFTSAHPGSVIQAGDITSPGNQVTLLGGIVINTGTIETSRGTVTIAAIPGENLVRITQEGNLLSLDLPLQEQALLNAETATLVASDLPALLSGGTVPENLGLVVTDNVVTLTSTDTAIPTDTGTAIVSGNLDAADVTATGTGGSIDVVGDRVGLLNATLDVSGTNGGGQVRIGGEYQGQGDIPNADQTHVDSSTTIAADAIVRGEGGRVIVWADDITQFFGTITAQGGSTSGDGGFAEVSGKESLRYDGQVFLSAPAGATGQLLLDPGIVLIGANGDDDSLLTAGNPGDPIFIAENQGGTNSTFQISTGQLVTTLTTSDVTIAAAQRIDLTQALDASGTDNDLTLNAPDINLFNDLILGSGDLTLTAANSSTTIAQDIGIFGDVIETAGGNITFNGTVVVDSFSPAFGDAINITTGFGTAGDITLNGPLDAQTDFADSVLLQAGTGNVVMAGAVGANSPLGLLDIRANDASLQDFAGDNLRADVTTFNLQASGNLDLDRGDINASETLSISAGGDLTLASASFLELTSFAGNINLNAQGNLLLASNSNSLNVDAENLNLQAGGSVSLQDLTGLAVSENTTVSAQTTATVNN